MGTRVEDLWQGYETFSILMGYKSSFLEKSMDEVINQRLKERLTDMWKW